MKHLKKSVILICLIFAGLQSMGQVKLGVKAGANISNIRQNYENSDNEVPTKMKLGYHIGLAVDYAVSEVLSIQPGLLYTTKGYAVDLEEVLGADDIDGYARVTYNYLEIPVNVAFKISGFQLSAGPYVAFGLSGKNKSDYTASIGGIKFEQKEEEKLKPVMGEAENNKSYNALDYGLNFGVGYEVGPILINAGYSLGLGNTTPKVEGSSSDPKDFKESNSVISVSLTFFLLGGE